MKLLLRTLAILVAGLLISGATFAIVGSSYAQALLPSGPQRGEAAGQRPPEMNAGTSAGTAADGTSSATPRAGEFGREGGGRPGGFAAVELLKNLGIIAVIVAIGVPIQRLASRRKTHKRPAAVAPADL
jgi:hypothetical protein